MFATSATKTPIPTNEEFYQFHSIDRELYRKLIINLGRDMVESMNVMAFWMWLEQQSTGGMTLVKRMLSLPTHVINNLADESVLCLKCAEKDHFSHPESSYVLNLLPDMLRRKVPLKFFYDHRVIVLRGVAVICSGVCARAFRDINQNVLNPATRRLPGQVGDFNRNDFFSSGGVEQGSSSMVGRRMSDHMRRAFSYAGFDEAGLSKVGRAFSFDAVNEADSDTVGRAFSLHQPGRTMVGRAFSLHQPGRTMVGRAFSFGGVDQAAGSSIVGSARPVLHTTEELGQSMQQGRAVYDELGEIFSNLNLEEEENEVDPEDRTIFLTFSKGYPITETEVRDFFTRLFGDFIEELQMQPVLPGEQVLYARVVARRASVIDAVVRGGKAKYNINGKHVCARKYVKKKTSSSSAAASIAQSRSNLAPPFARR